MNVQPLTFPSNMQAGDYASIMADVKEDPAVKKAQQNIDAYVKECDRLDNMLKLDRSSRIAQAGDIGTGFWNQEATIVAHTYGAFMLLGYMGLGLGLIMAGTNAGIIDPGLKSLLAIGVIATAFWKKGFPAVVRKVSGKWLIPPRVDKRIKRHIQNERSQAESRLAIAKDTLQQTELKVMNRLAEKAAKEMAEGKNAGVVQLDEEPTVVVIDGVKLQKKDSLMGYFPGLI